MNNQDLTRTIEQLMAEMSLLREELTRLKAAPPEGPATAVTPVKPSAGFSSSRRRMLGRLAAGLLVGVGAAAGAGAVLPGEAQAKFVTSPRATTIIVPPNGSVTGSIPANTVYGLIVTPDANLDFSPFSDNVKGGVLGITTQNGGTGVFGQGPDSGVNGFSPSGIGVKGFSAGNRANSYGVYGETTSQTAQTSGVFGVSPINGVFGAGTTGVVGLSTGTNPNAAPIGVYGEARAQDPSSSGVYGTGPVYGVYGTGATGVYGTGATYGVHGKTTATNSSGVFGEGPFGVYGSGNYGVYGIGPNIGVYGTTTTTNYAGYFDGKVQVVGFLAKTAGTFKIDHPLDPANKYLYHSFVESPDMMNIYNGIVALDEQGEATVEMPDWFEALNSDYRYQLTSLGVSGPNLYISEKLSNLRFKIAGGVPGQEVSWQVTGIRQDAFARAHRVQVEEDKSEQERGKYLHPEVFGISGEDAAIRM